MSKKIFLTFLLIAFLFFAFSSFCFAQGRELEIEYPEVPGVETPTKTKTALPEYLRYIFTFAIIIAGLLAFGALIYGGIRHLTSAGDPTKMSDARAQVTAGILGLIILLSSYLILNTINPQLVLPKKPPLQPAVAGIRIYSMEACQENEENPSYKVNGTGDIKDLNDPDLNWGFDGKQIKSIKFLGNPGILTVNLWSDIEFKGIKTSVNYPTGDTEPCKPIAPVTYKSISLDYHIPGVYLYANNSCSGVCPSDDCKIYPSGSATLPDFDDKAQSIKIVPGDFNSDLGKYQLRFGAVLHEKENYMGEAAVFDINDIGENNCYKLSDSLNGQVVMNNKASSITIYLKPKFKKDGTEQIVGPGVKFWEDKNYTKEKDEVEIGYYGDGKKIADLNTVDANDEITSMEMDGHYVALLFRDKNYKDDCEVFMSNDPDFRNNRIGQCGWLGRSDCLSSFIIKARK